MLWNNRISYHLEDSLTKERNSLICNEIFINNYDKDRVSDQPIPVIDILYKHGLYWLFRIGDFEETLNTALWENARFKEIDENIPVL